MSDTVKSSGKPRVVIFDFDGTITRFDSSTYAVRQLILSSPARLAAALYVLPVGLSLMLSRRTEEIGGSMFVWIASTRRSRDGWLKALRDVSDNRLDPRRINQEVVKRLRAHVDAGDEVYIVTGSAATVARTICDTLKIDVPIIGSKLKPFLGGYVSHIHCIGPRKVERLRTLHQLQKWDVVYSDSYRDIPLMQKARQVVLVNPSRLTLTRVQQQLHKDIDVEVMRIP